MYALKRVQHWRSGWVISEVKENQWVMMLELVDWPRRAMCATLKKWHQKSRRTTEKQSEMALTVPILYIKFYGRIWRWRRCVRSWFLKSWHGTEGIMSPNCWNVFGWLGGGSDASWMHHYGWWVVGFQIWSVHKVSVNAVEKEGWTTAQKSSHDSVPAGIDFNFIFRRPRCGDGGMGAVSEKCRHCFLNWNTLEIENLYRKEEVVGGEPVLAPPQQCPQPPSRFNAKVPWEEQ